MISIYFFLPFRVWSFSLMLLTFGLKKTYYVYVSHVSFYFNTLKWAAENKLWPNTYSVTNWKKTFFFLRHDTRKSTTMGFVSLKEEFLWMLLVKEYSEIIECSNNNGSIHASRNVYWQLLMWKNTEEWSKWESIHWLDCMIRCVYP